MSIVRDRSHWNAVAVAQYNSCVCGEDVAREARLSGTVSIASLGLGSQRSHFEQYAVRACGEQEDHVHVCALHTRPR